MRTIWHVAAMGNWQEVVREQLELLWSVGIAEVDCTFVGEGLDWLLAQPAQYGITLSVRRSDPNILHYETFAMLWIEEIIRLCDDPILYFHTKGVSVPASPGHVAWRHLMQNALIRNWQTLLPELENYDAIGVNWIDGHRPHFGGNFWLARADWIRGLPAFVPWHQGQGFVRFSCENWIGARPGCRVKSLVYRNEPFWEVPKGWRWGDGSSHIEVLHKIIDHPCTSGPGGSPCNRFRLGHAYDVANDCRTCWNFAHSPSYNRFYGGDGKVVPAPRELVNEQPPPRPLLLGDAIEKALSWAGLTKERARDWLGVCSCAERQRRFNELHEMALAAMKQPAETARKLLGKLIGF